MAVYQPAYRRAYTLTELLIVIMIALLLMVVSLPMLKSVMEDARPREASRVLNTVFFTAKAQAAVTNRLSGVDFVMQPVGNPGANPVAYQCTQMFMCEVPPLYCGDTTTARATINLDTQDPPMPPAPQICTYRLYLQDSAITSISGMAPTPDNTTINAYALTDQPDPEEDIFEIRFDCRGLWYTARRSSTANQFTIEVFGSPPVCASSSPGATPPYYRSASFQIRRPPVRIGNPVELPKSTAIDMTYSGYGPTSNMAYDQMTRRPPVGMEFAPALGLRIMFAPEGNVYNVTMASRNNMGQLVTTRSPPNGTIHFLVGLPSKVSTLHQTGITGAYNAFDPTISNLADANALWVSIGRTSGVVTTNENAPNSLGIADPSNVGQRAQYFRDCRQYATSREQKGGR